MSSPAEGGDLEALQGEVSRMRDQREVEALKHAYTAALDSGYDLEAIAGLFTADARWIADGFGEHRGRDQIVSFFGRLSRTVIKVRHFATSPQVDLAPDGTTATARWSLLCLCSRRHCQDPEVEVPVVEVGTYRDRLVKVDGRWYFEELSVEVAFSRRVTELVRPPG
ncbi:MAG: nuclear transport factor 2 family protein [Actinobacteria bacterium]|nr:nuclear transport factor 2 family protein [Actinomycetota bacterium]